MTTTEPTADPRFFDVEYDLPEVADRFRGRVRAASEAAPSPERFPPRRSGLCRGTGFQPVKTTG